MMNVRSDRRNTQSAVAKLANIECIVNELQKQKNRFN